MTFAKDKKRSSRLGNGSVSNRASDLARELKEPLLALAAETRALAEKYDQPGAEGVQGILQQIGRLQNILSAYLVADSNIRAPRLKSVDLGTVVNECILLLAASSQEGTRLQLSQAPNLLPVFADEAQLAQALCILAVNTMKTAGAARVAISTGRIQIAGAPRQVFVEIATDGTAATQFDALGDEPSDLRVVKRIIDVHGGDFLIESPRRDIGVGVRYTIKLPELVEFHI
jgi:signal transduction histidine kinase